MANFFKQLLGTSKKKKSGGVGLLGDILGTAVSAIPLVGEFLGGLRTNVQNRAAAKFQKREDRAITQQALQALTGPGFIDNRSQNKANRTAARVGAGTGIVRRTSPLASRGGSIAAPDSPIARERARRASRPGAGRRVSSKTLRTVSGTPLTTIPRTALPSFANAPAVQRTLAERSRLTKGRRTVVAGLGVGALSGVAKFLGTAAASGAAAEMMSRAVTRRAPFGGSAILQKRARPPGGGRFTGFPVGPGPIRGPMPKLIGPPAAGCPPTARPLFGLDPNTACLVQLQGGMIQTAQGCFKPLALFRFNERTGQFQKIKKRRMNPLNFTALKRAGRRMDGFQKVIMKEFRCEERGKSLKPRKRKVTAKKRRRS